MSDDIRPLLAGGYVADWRIHEFLDEEVRIPLNENGFVDLEDIVQAVAANVDDVYISLSRVEFRESGTGQPWQVLCNPPPAHEPTYVDQTGEIVVRLLVEAQREGHVLTPMQRQRLQQLLRRGSS